MAYRSHDGLCWWALHITEVKKSLNQRAHSFRVQLCLFPFVGRKTRQKLFFCMCKVIQTLWACGNMSLISQTITKDWNEQETDADHNHYSNFEFIANTIVQELRTSANLSVAASGSSSWSCLNTEMPSYRKIWRKILNWFNRRTRKWSFTLPNHLSFCKRLW